jgi:hypothetical protein
MAGIYYQLTKVSNLTCFAAEEDGSGGWTDSRLPGGMDGVSGIYLILNETTSTPNRYVGIAQDLGHRFGTRLASVCELGLSQGALERVIAFWGYVWMKSDKDTNWTKITDYSAPLSRRINTSHFINLEKLLIRFFMEKFTHSRGHTMTNNMLIKSAYRNPTTDIDVTLEWKTTSGATGKETHTWGAGTLW